MLPPAPPAKIVQEYIDRPMLLDSYKFDLRVYVLVTSVMPLRAYLYEVGKWSLHVDEPIFF
jgi:hypothetical protein